MELIVKESNRLNKILSDFLAYARIDRPAYNKVELCHVITDVLKILYHHQSHSEAIEMNFESEESILYVVGDEDLIKQLLLNLAVNACEALDGSSGRVVFAASVTGDGQQVELLIQDDGPGIDSETLKNIYQPFFSTKKQGTGLGLSIVHRIASALKLDLAVDSEVNGGTTFRVVFQTYRPGHQHAPEFSIPDHSILEPSDAAGGSPPLLNHWI